MVVGDGIIQGCTVSSIVTVRMMSTYAGGSRVDGSFLGIFTTRSLNAICGWHLHLEICCVTYYHCAIVRTYAEDSWVFKSLPSSSPFFLHISSSCTV